MKTEKGVMLMKDGLAWGVTYDDGRSTSHGWISPEDAPIHNPKFCKKPSDVTYKGDYCMIEIKKGKLVHVVRTTEVSIV